MVFEWAGRLSNNIRVVLGYGHNLQFKETGRDLRPLKKWSRQRAFFFFLGRFHVEMHPLGLSRENVHSLIKGQLIVKNLFGEIESRPYLRPADAERQVRDDL